MDERVKLQELFLSSVDVFSQIRDAFVESFEGSREAAPEFVAYSSAQMRYYSERCQSLSILLQETRLWDCDILMRSIIECASQYMFVCISSEPERSEKIHEYETSLSEIASILRTEKARKAAHNTSDADDAMLIGGAALDSAAEATLRSKWPKASRQALKQKWSFSEIARQLETFKAPGLDLTSYGSLLHSYGLGSHLLHADQTAMDLMADRDSREAVERALMEAAHFARLTVEPTYLFYLCWRGMQFSTGRAVPHKHILERISSLGTLSAPFHSAFADSQRQFYAPKSS